MCLLVTRRCFYNSNLMLKVIAWYSNLKEGNITIEHFLKLSVLWRHDLAYYGFSGFVDTLMTREINSKTQNLFSKYF